MKDLHYLIAISPKHNSVLLIGGSDADIEFKNAVVKENYQTDRAYIVDKDNESKEYASLPLAITSIFTDYGE